MYNLIFRGISMYVVASFNTADYQDLADLTDAPKKEFCDRYGYQFFVLKEKKYSPITGFNKVHFVLELFQKYPDIEWLLFSECDATITNLTMRIENKIDNDYHFIVPVDRLSINAGNFLARNSEQGRAYLKMIIDKEPDYQDEPWAEQQVIIDTIDENSDIVKIVEQKYMNSYEPQIYDYCDARFDIMGKSGAWEPGDWIVHWPGTHKPIRMSRAQAVMEKIVR
jgi:galactosyl transferase GMA12/MNN10 family